MLDANRQIKLGAIMSYVAIAFNILAGLIYTPWIISHIGLTDYGLFTLSVSIIGFFSLDFGLGTAVTRFLSKFKAENNEEKQEVFLGVTFILHAIIGLIIAIVLFIVFLNIGSIYHNLSPTEISKLKVLFIVTGLYTVTAFMFKPFDGILQANERFVFLKLMALVQKILVILLMVISIFVGYGLYALVIVNALVGMIKIAFQYIYIKQSIHLKVNFHEHSRIMYMEIFVFSGWTTVALTAQRFMLSIMPSVIASLAGAVEVSVFAIACVVEGYSYTISNAFAGLFLPRVTKLVEKNIKEVELLLIKLGRIQLYIIGLIFIGFLVFGKEFIYLWVGEKFNSSYYVAVLIIFPLVLTLPMQIANTTLIAKNEVKYLAKLTLVSAFITFPLAIVFTRIYGVLGTGLSIFIGAIVGKVFYAMYVYVKVLNFDIYLIIRKCYFAIIPTIFLSCLFGILLNIITHESNYYNFILKSLSISLFYFLCLSFFVLDDYENKLLGNLWQHLVKHFVATKK